MGKWTGRFKYPDCIWEVMNRYSNCKPADAADNDLHVKKDVMRRILILSLMAITTISLIYILVGSTTVVIGMFSYVFAIGGIVVFCLAKDFDRKIRGATIATRDNTGR